MQKAFERIVERLKEVGQFEVKMIGGRCNGKTLTLGYKKGIANAISIVNQVAEEHEQEVCEWEFFHVSAGFPFYKTCTEIIPYIPREDKKYCPYCGKKIKVVE